MASRFADLSCLRDKSFAFLVNAPENCGHSNGITVFLHAAQLAQSLGLDVVIVPAHTTTASYTELPEPFLDLPLRWEVPEGCCALLGDTITSDRLLEVRARASQICHYTLAPLGLFSGEGTWGNHLLLQPGERQAVFSPQISTQIPSFYLQPRFDALEPWIEASLQAPPRKRIANPRKQLCACIYAGKGYLRPLHPLLRKRISRTSSRLLTRLHPSTKMELYRQLASADLLVSFDPLSSLAYEASLLGVPTFIDADWDESEFKSLFPVRLDGVFWRDRTAFLEILNQGFDHRAVVASYREALTKNLLVVQQLLAYAFCHSGEAPASAERLNRYWDARQPFFSSLGLPSPPSAWTPIQAALPAWTGTEHLQELHVAVIARLVGLKRRVARRCRSLASGILRRRSGNPGVRTRL
jgi:hypothetical protein